MTVKETNGVRKLCVDEIYIYAETAFSHEGDIAYLYQLAERAKKAGSNAIKFQLMLNPEESYVPEVIAQSECFNWYFEKEQWIKLLKYIKFEKKLDVVLLPVDMCAMEFCMTHQELYDMIEVHSINFNHYMMLRQMDKLDKVIILGIGGRTLADIEYALQKLPRAYSEKRILLMHGFQSFPTKKENAKLGRIAKYRALFGLEVGYADHTSYKEDDIPLFQFAYLNGSRFFEKHIVLEEGKERTDYQAAKEAGHLLEIKRALKTVADIQGNDSVWELASAETEYRKREKKVVAIKDIVPNEILTEKNLGYKVTNQMSAYEQKDLEKLLGKCSVGITEKDSTDILPR
ncbi:MAG: hypothetical protein HDR16_08430 [Lachnospiraceae bacterium]|nr:hypothetical protein [Lachnospiraceae bacterium]